MLSDSKNAPCFEAPSPKKQRTTCPVPRICAPHADDPRRSEEAVRDVRQVHRAPEPLAEAIPAPVDLGHHRLRVGAASDRVPVAAVRGEELVVRPEGRDRADDRRLGPVREMRVPADHAGVVLERPLDPFLELANPGHLAVDPDEMLAFQRLDPLR
jgi:hypothetical protein